MDDSASSTWSYNICLHNITKADFQGAITLVVATAAQRCDIGTICESLAAKLCFLVSSELLPVIFYLSEQSGFTSAASLQHHVITMKRRDRSHCNSPNYVLFCKERKNGSVSDLFRMRFFKNCSVCT